jgi:hypothetical protein
MDPVELASKRAEGFLCFLMDGIRLSFLVGQQGLTYPLAARESSYCARLPFRAPEKFALQSNYLSNIREIAIWFTASTQYRPTPSTLATFAPAP